jgi:hypothetical protein
LKRFAFKISAPSFAALMIAGLLASCGSSEPASSSATPEPVSSQATAKAKHHAKKHRAKKHSAKKRVASVSSAGTGRCSDYSTQADAQRAADTRDADGDGIYCESLPCPCLKKGGKKQTGTSPKPEAGCSKPSTVQRLGFSATKYPNIRRHFLSAVRRGWPSILVVDRTGASSRRDRLLTGIATKSGYDRDEYPPAVGRGRGSSGLKRGANPVGWMASVMLVPSSENRSHGSVMGIKLRRFCSGTRFRYVFY